MKFGLKHVFVGASIGLTFVSLWAGWHLYATMFGFALAFLISIIFEVLRLSCLYSFTNMKGAAKGIVVGLYVILSFVCFSAGVLSFNSKIIKSEDDRKMEIQKAMSSELHLIRTTYSQKIDEQIKVVEKHKGQMAVFLIQNPSSKVYPEKIRLDEEKILELNHSREEFFASIGQMPTPEWISAQKAILNIKDVNDVYENVNSPVARAASELFGIGDTKLQKYAGVVLTFSIEVGIILLVILSMRTKEPVMVVEPPKKRGRPRKEKTDE